jgi:microcystin-dependent protein
MFIAVGTLNTYGSDSRANQLSDAYINVAWTGYIAAGQEVYIYYDALAPTNIDSNQITITKVGGSGVSSNSQWITNGADVYYNTGSVGVGTTAPSSKAALDVSSNTKGFLPPRMTLAERNAISTPIPAGMVIYNTNANELNVYNGTAWVSAASSSNMLAKDTAFLTLSTIQQSNLLPNVNHIEFDTSIGNLALSSGGGQLNGLVTLMAGRTYHLKSNIRAIMTNANEHISVVWRDITNGVNYGSVGMVSTFTPGNFQSSSQAEAIITPVTNIQVALSIAGVAGTVIEISGGNNPQGQSSAYIESISDYTVPGYLPNNGGTLGGDLSIPNNSLVVGAAAPNSKAALDVSSNTKGFLPPRMTLAERNAISTPIPAGMVIYNTNANELNVYNGTAWVSAASSSNMLAKDTAFLTMPDQTSNLAAGDHVEFNQIAGNLALSTGSGQANGRVTLIAGRKYKLVAALYLNGGNNGAYVKYTWHIVGGTDIGILGSAISTGINNSDSTQQDAIAVITPVTNIDVELQFKSPNSVSGILGGYSYAWIESISDYTVPGYLPNNGGTLGGDLSIPNNSLVVGAAAPNSKAALDVSSNTKGFLPPRMTTLQRDSISPPISAGMLIYNTNTNELNIHNGTTWVNVASAVASSNSYIRLTDGITQGTALGNNILHYGIVNESSGTDITYIPSIINGDAFLINKSGIYSIAVAGNSASNTYIQINVGTPQNVFNTADSRTTGYSGSAEYLSAAWTGFIQAGQSVYIMNPNGTSLALPELNTLTIAKVGGSGGVSSNSQWTTNGADIYYTTGSVGVGTTAPNSKAALDVSSNTKGFLPPRMTLAERNAISAPIPAGMVVFNTDTNELNVYNGTVWSAPVASSTPAGSMIMFAGVSTNVPAGYLVCDGSEVSRTTYAALFAAIGTTYGVGDGSTTFNLPDMQGAAPAGAGTSSATKFPSPTQQESITLGEYSNDQFQGHHHNFSMTSPANDFITTPINNGNTGRYNTTTAGTAAYDAGFTITGPISDGVTTPRTGTVTKGKTVGVNFIIKY